MNTQNTPPADGVREAVDHAVRAALSPLGIDYVPWWKVVHAVRDSLLAEPMLEVRTRETVTDALAMAWDEGVRTAGAYGHEDTWTHDMTPYTENPYRGDVRPRGTVADVADKEEAVTSAYNAVTGADDEGWSPDRTIAVLNALWDAGKGFRS